MSEPFNPPRLSDRLAVAAAKPPPPVIVHADGRQKVRKTRAMQRQVARNKKDYARKRLRDAPHLKNADLLSEILSKFGTALSGSDLADLRQELGLRPSKSRLDRLNRQKAPSVLNAADFAISTEALRNLAAQKKKSQSQQAAKGITVHHALRRVLDHMRERGIERLVLFDTGSYDIHNKQRSVFEPDA